MPIAAFGQNKSAADVQKGVEKALAATQNEKKATKAATWESLAKAYMAAYEQPTQNLLPNSPRGEVKLFLKGQQIVETKEVKGAETVYSVDVYPDKELYYNANDMLEFWIVTNPAVENALDKGIAALDKAQELSNASGKPADYSQLAEQFHQKYYSEALNHYFLGENGKASEGFEKTAKASECKALNVIDTVSIYYAALMANLSGNPDRALSFYDKCRTLGYYSEGTLFSNMADIKKKMGDTLACKALLEEGFTVFPQNQGILIGLINLYTETKDDPDRLFDLIHTAQANEPNNASLYYVEGDVHKKLGNYDEAVKYFYKSTEIDPNYIYGVLNVGILYYDKAVDLQTKASEELDDAKYSALVDQLNEALESAIEPFEKSFEMSKDKEIKNAIAEYLKNIFFRFRDKGDEYQASYDKYNNYLKEN